MIVSMPYSKAVACVNGVASADVRAASDEAEGHLEHGGVEILQLDHCREVLAVRGCLDVVAVSPQSISEPLAPLWCAR
jgi:hypothetical protein